MYDIIIVGAGPAGMTAAIYASIARKKILLLEKSVYGGQIVTADKIKNYPGFDEISGYEYATKLYNQLKNFNPDIKFEGPRQWSRPRRQRQRPASSWSAPATGGWGTPTDGGWRKHR